MSDTLADLAFASAGDLAQAIARRELSALEATDAAIARIEARDGPVNAVVVRDFGRAREAARAADARLARGEQAPLLGVPMTVKESVNVAGVPTTWGFEEAKAFVAPVDAVLVQRLKTAGAVILGKTNIPVALGDWQSANPVYGRTSNPWDLTRTPGGSSGGAAAALAAGMVHLEFGSDIGGSIRVPAGFCGVYGHKPSFGLVPSRGHAPPAADGVGVVLGVVGPLARTAGDLGLALDVTAGPADEEAKGYRLDLPAPRHGRIAGCRVLVLDQHPTIRTDGAIRGAVTDLADKLERLGAKVARTSGLLPDLAKLDGQYQAMLDAAVSRGAPPPNPMTVYAWMDLADAQLAARRQFAKLFEDFDVILAPNFGQVAFPHIDQVTDATTLRIDGKDEFYGPQLAWAGPASFANLPATAIPIGLTETGLPVGAQVIGPYLEDRTTIAFAGLLEREVGGFARPPGY